MQVIITAKTDALGEMAKRLDPTRLTQALSVSVNDTARHVRRYAVSSIAKESSLPRDKVESGLNILPYSTPATLEAKVVGSGSPIALKYFKASQTGAGVSATVWGKRQLYKGAFISDELYGHAFHRLSRKRLPIKKMWGAGIGQVMAQAHVGTAIVAIGEQRLYINAQRQLDRYIAGAGGANR